MGPNARILTATLAVLYVLGGCIRESRLQQNKIDLLFDPTGKERETPGLDLYARFRESSDVRQLVDLLVEVLNSEGGYTRVLAAEQLLAFFEDEANAKQLTPSVCRAMADHAIELAPPLGSWAQVSASELSKGRIPKEIEVRLRPRCIVRFDQHDYVLRDRLPKGWRGVDGTVVLDGRVIARTRIYGDPEAPLEVVDIVRALGARSAPGEHTLVSSIVLVTPTGTRISKESVGTFRVVEYVDERAKAIKALVKERR